MIPIQPAPAGLPSGSFGRTRARRAPARLGWLMAAPHRLGFFAGGTMLALSAAWWALALVARHAGVAVPWAVSPTTAHALLMAFGFMPFFFIGFLFTAGPRWLGLPAVPAAGVALPVGVMAAGWLLALLGFHASAALAAVGLAGVAMGLALATGRFALMVADSPVADRDHPVLVSLGCGLTALALWVAAVAVALHHDAAALAAVQAALWGGLAVVFVVVAHRMIPFFTAAALPSLDVWRPRALLLLLVAGVALQAPFAVAQAWGGTLAPDLAGLRAAFELPFGALLLWLALRWGLVQSLKIRLLAMLHMGFFWLGVAFTLGGVSDVLLAISGGQLSLGLAPLHALTMGYLGSTLFAMATRVASGHSGRTLAADDWAWAFFWAAQVAVAARVGAALIAPAAATLTLLAAQFWLAACAGWALRYGRWFLTPRADGNPG